MASELQVLQSWGSVHGEPAAGGRPYSTDFIPLLGCSPASPEPSADELEASIGSSCNPLPPKFPKTLRFAPQLPHPHPQDMSRRSQPGFPRIVHSFTHPTAEGLLKVGRATCPAPRGPAHSCYVAHFLRALGSFLFLLLPSRPSSVLPSFCSGRCATTP